MLDIQDHISKSYNGWSNYETWLVNLWIDNNENNQNRLIEINKINLSIYRRAELLKEWIANENAPKLGNTLYNDLLTSALSEVNWVEIIQNNIEEQ